MSAVPEIETPRLRLRAPREADFETAAAFLSGPRTVHMGGPYTPLDAWRVFASYVGSWRLQGFGYWAVDERETGALAGAVGFTGAPPFPENELGWELYDGFEGRGYATEAARAARSWWFGPRGKTALVSYVDPENARSIRVGERIGAVRDPAAVGPDPEDLVFRHPRPAADAR